ncbi:MAG: peptidylprolyl isomerase [Bacteroidaceae bacterium]|nr:peptidylprolyl isomerase [Bacteroidaceae bacterium]
MKLNFLATMLVSFMALTACNGQTGEEETEVMIETNLGDIRIKLYNDTPIHRDNFLKNVKEGKYDECTWHRIIRNFMIQAGPQTDTAESDSADIDTASLIPAEIRFPKHFHRRGAVAAAREGDDVNPGKKSDPIEFYIVTGRTYTEDGLRELKYAVEQKQAEEIYQQKQIDNKERLEALRRARDFDGLSDLLQKLQNDAQLESSDRPIPDYTPDQKRSFRTVGGAPWLDREYTVFGEVVEGMKTVLAIEKTKTDSQDRPLAEVKILKAYIVE